MLLKDNIQRLLRVSKDKDSFYYLVIKNNKIRPKAYLKPIYESKSKMTQILDHLFSNPTSGEVSTEVVSFQSRNF